MTEFFENRDIFFFLVGLLTMLGIRMIVTGITDYFVDTRYRRRPFDRG